MTTDLPLSERVILLDRDGTINVEVDYLSHPDQLELLPGAAEGLRRLQARGHRLVVLTNQSGVGRGYFSEVALGEIHDRLRELLAEEGVTLSAIYYCPHVPDDDCDCRKPKTGLADRAARELGFDLTHAVMIGDKASDIGMGRTAGALTVLVRSGYGAAHEAASEADHVVDDLAAAADLVVNKGLRSMNTTSTRAAREARVVKWLEASIALKQATVAEQTGAIVRAAETIAASLRAGGKLMICGNGGSAADAQHMAAELVSRLTMAYDRPAIAALALTTDTSFLTAFTNDIGYVDIFARQVQALGRPGDVLLGISTSGNSQNVIAAVEVASDLGIATVSLGGSGGKLPEIADVAICVPGGFTPHIQETHLAIEHVICDIVERELFGYEEGERR